ncbi:unnamed protein product, partial [marine sediment metagenome]
KMFGIDPRKIRIEGDEERKKEAQGESGPASN